MPNKKHNVRPLQITLLVERSVEHLMDLAKEFRNPSQKQALHTCCNLLRAAPQNRDPAAFVVGFSSTIRSAKFGNFYCVMAIVSRILAEYYWLAYHKEDDLYDARFRKLKNACYYLSLIHYHGLDKFAMIGCVKTGYLLKKVD